MKIVADKEGLANNYGKHLRIDMELMMKAINEKFGWDFVKEFTV